jgi:hypothetical protein
MADLREVFTIVEDNTTGEGIKLPGRQEGDAIGSNHMPAMVAKDGSGNYKLIELRAAGAAAASTAFVPVLPVKDLAGNLQQINARDEGDAISGVDALPAMVAKSASGNFAYLKLNAAGELIVSHEAPGVEHRTSATVASVVGTPTTVASITLTAGKVYQEPEWTVASTFSTLWQLIGVEDEAGTPVETLLAQCITGPGAFSFGQLYERINYTAGTVGILKLKIVATQLNGPVTDLHATLGVIGEV